MWSTTERALYFIPRHSAQNLARQEDPYVTDYWSKLESSLQSKFRRFFKVCQASATAGFSYEREFILGDADIMLMPVVVSGFHTAHNFPGPKVHQEDGRE